MFLVRNLYYFITDLGSLILLYLQYDFPNPFKFLVIQSSLQFWISCFVSWLVSRLRFFSFFLQDSHHHRLLFPLNSSSSRSWRVFIFCSHLSHLFNLLHLLYLLHLLLRWRPARSGRRWSPCSPTSLTPRMTRRARGRWGDMDKVSASPSPSPY